MRKILLFACAAVVSLSASAQSLKDCLSKSVAKVNTVKSEAFTAAVPKIAVGPQQKVAKAAPARIAHDGIYGLYVSSTTDETGIRPACDSVTIKKGDFQIEGLDQKLNTEIILHHETAPLSFYGYYDESAKTITCPALQYIGEFNREATESSEAVNYKFYLASWLGESLDDLNNVKYSTDPVTFTVDEEGSISLDQLGLLIGIDGQEYQWTNYFNVTFYPANAVWSSNVGENKAPSLNAVYVDDYGTSVTVYGFAPFPNASGFGLSCVANLDISDQSYQTKDGETAYSVVYTAGQNVWRCKALGVTDTEAGDYFRTYGIKDMADKPGYVTYDDSEGATVTGAVIGNTLYLNPLPVATNIWLDPVTKEPRGHIIWMSSPTITLDNGAFSVTGGESGINNVNTTVDTKNAKTYNLFGQEVPASTKGLVIRAGKKFFNK